MQDRKPIFTVRELCATALGAALIAICSWISIPSPSGIAFTLQTFAICLVTGLLGLKCGTFSVLVYLLLGAINIPVFSGFRGGIGALFGVTGGYLIGFIFTALAVGFFTDRFGKRLPVLIVSMILGLALCYAFGSIWFQILYVRSNDTAMTIPAILMMCVVPYLIPDAIKIALAVFLVKVLKDKLPIRAS